MRRREGLCVRCGYDLTGNVSGTCPECGTVVPRGAMEHVDVARSNFEAMTPLGTTDPRQFAKSVVVADGQQQSPSSRTTIG